MSGEAPVSLDGGATVVTALAISPSGEHLAKVRKAYPLAMSRAGWVEQDPEDWRQASRRPLARHGDAPARMEGGT